MNTEYCFPNFRLVIYFWAISFTLWPAKLKFSKQSPLRKGKNVRELCSKGVAKKCNFHSGFILVGYKGCSKLPPNVWRPGTIIHRLCSICELRYCSRRCQNMISTAGSVSQWPPSHEFHCFNIKILCYTSELSAMLTCFF